MFCTDKVAAAHMRSKILKVFSAAGITMKEQEFFEAATMQEGRPQLKGGFLPWSPNRAEVHARMCFYCGVAA